MTISIYSGYFTETSKFYPEHEDTLLSSGTLGIKDTTTENEGIIQ